MDNQQQQRLMEENFSLKKLLADQAIELEFRKRQLEVEAALDNVRLRAGVMRSSSELGEASAVLFQQLNELGINAIRTAVGIFDDPNDAMELWLTSYAGNGEMTRMLYYFNLHIHPVFENIIPARRENKPYALTILSGTEVRDYYHTMSTYLSAPRQQVFNETEYFYSFFFSNGTINVVANQPLSEEQCNITIRCAQVFGLIYTRFLDLQTAETSAREAQIESALERVRAKALAMQQPEDLKDVIQVFRHEMGTLGVDELEISDIYVYDENGRKSECWFAVKDSQGAESKIVSAEFKIDLNATWVGREMLQFYHSDAKETSIAMAGDHYKEWIRYCETKCGSYRDHYEDEMPGRSYHLYKFSDGAISQPSASVISQESWDLLKRVASVFTLTYSRFKDLMQARIDLQNLKEEKTRAENALMELKATQKQLIQSEKMASLGELTAGIAHEIQNPLNFINNFSDVNKELIEELMEERQKNPGTGRQEIEDEILNDIKANEKKISHHGKRADAIVKGMLQHSRTSSGQKELTDINALCDEYLRLAYHGLRAKDKDFNAKLEIDPDPSIGKINVVSQDLSRVILNLINNAFYAVNEKQSQNLNGYEPTVAVTTVKQNGQVEIKIFDNGNGIPKKIQDKIFNPFFTTKPTGQGTGLGLSLAYDIVKAHGGEISFQTRDGEESEFIVTLPI